MPSGPAYTPRRRLVMQIVMWALFVLVTLAAAVLAHVKSGMWRVDLEPAQRYGGVELRLPSGWQVNQRTGSIGEQIEVRELAEPGRSISIRTMALDGPTEPIEFLAQSGLLEIMTLTSEDVRKIERLQVPDGEGIIVYPRRSRASFALITYRDAAILVQMTTRQRMTPEDEAILYHLSNSIRLMETPR